jgi:hypothetical protein
MVFILPADVRWQTPLEVSVLAKVKPPLATKAWLVLRTLSPALYLYPLISR